MKLLPLCCAGAAILAVMQLPAKYQPKLPESTKVVARVSGKDITAGEVTPYLWDWRGSEAVEDMINYRLVKEHAEKVGVKVAPEVVEAELTKQIDRVKASLQPEQDLEQFIRDQGFPRSRLYLRLHSELLLDAIVMKNFEVDRYVEVSTIIIRPRSETASDLADAIKKAEDAYDALVKGGKWEDILLKYCNEPQATASNGRLGWRLNSVFPAPVRQEFLTAKAGGYTRPAQTQNGIQIFRLDRRGRDAKGEDLEALKNQFRFDARPGMIEQLRKDAKIERFLDK